MIRSHHLRKGLSFLLGLGAVASIEASVAAPVHAFPWGELIFRGIELLQLSTISPQQRIELGADIHQQIASNYEFNTNSQLNAYVDRIGQQLAAASDCSEYPFRFFVIQDPSINAFTTTGGFVYVNTGLIDAADNQAQLAGVLAHEIGHICNDDLIDRLQQTAVAQGAASLTGLDRSTLVSLGYQIAVDLPWSRRAELAADVSALEYVTRAGYDPYALPNFLSKLLNAPSPPAFFSSHPAPEVRIEALEEQLAGAPL
ncbi:MAG: M48 family metallopeptidase [Elainellaceae cyanobacterium]